MTTTMQRRLGLGDAVAIGLGSMIGAGVFVVFAPAAAAAGSWLPLSLLIAGAVALCNALSSAQLAAQYPVAGGSYVYGRERLGPWPGFLAGWCFVTGKTASCAAMAMTFAAYTVDASWQRPVAALAVIVLVSVNCLGVTRTAAATKLLVGVVLAVLAVVVVAGALSDRARTAALFASAPPGGAYGVLQAGGLLFFAFAGYARIATMGEEVRDPARTIPRAIVTALLGALLVYGGPALLALTVLGPDALARTTTPLADLAAAGGLTWTTPVVRVGAAAATLGALLAGVAGIARTSLAMARTADLPRALAVLDDRHGIPRRAEIALALVVVVLVLTVDVRGVVGFSSFGVLLYYLVANLSAVTQTGEHRRYPRAVPVTGAVLCTVLVVTLPAGSVGVGILVLVVGIACRAVRVRAR
ncbi:amino acid permease [Kocuria tytonicola]|uniref:APC family permease n=1 Tax=Kocuria tytonicola TaxID=2055946 RepID=UPI000EF8BC01|nr:APC family permease [Kocuria tytonicola]RLZ03171.1 amino acid permease [Kocuria tytonicola]